MKKRANPYKKGRLPVGKLFAAGFFAGVLFPNICWKMEWHQKTAASMYLISTFAGRGVDGMEYLKQVLRMRGSYFLLAVLCGFSVFGVPLAVIGILLLGLEMGMLLTLSILQFGLSGGAVGAGLFIPQYLVYLPVTFFVMGKVYEQSMEVWRNRGIFPKRAYVYTVQTFLAGVIYSGGILLETFCNPWITQWLLKSLKIF